MGVFKPPVGTTTPLSNNALALNGKSEDQLSVATATNADKLDNLDASEFATSEHLHTDVYEPVISSKNSAFNVDFGTDHTTAAYGDHAHTYVTGPEGATAGNFPLLDVTGKILSDSTYAPDDFATTAHTHTGYVATSDYEDLDVLNKIKNVDGYGSGLDADLWQGYTPQNITISNAYNAIQLDGECSYAYKNVVIFNGICNTPPSTYSGATYMVGISPSGDFTGYPFGTVLCYNGTSWDVIGNV